MVVHFCGVYGKMPMLTMVLLIKGGARTNTPTVDKLVSMQQSHTVRGNLSCGKVNRNLRNA